MFSKPFVFMPFLSYPTLGLLWGGGGGALTGDRELITMLPSAVCKAMYLWAETGSFPKGSSARLVLWYRYLWLSSCKRSECSQQIQPGIQGGGTQVCFGERGATAVHAPSSVTCNFPSVWGWVDEPLNCYGFKWTALHVLRLSSKLDFVPQAHPSEKA